MEKISINKFAFDELEKERTKLNEMFINKQCYSKEDVYEQSCKVDSLMNEYQFFV